MGLGIRIFVALHRPRPQEGAIGSTASMWVSEDLLPFGGDGAQPHGVLGRKSLS